ncbi:TPA: VOC family protein [Legionella pneumophila]|nr:VOC family protein [Legionella pneumophila]HAT8182203.1 VOC family protein [Legionella pneumophila]
MNIQLNHTIVWTHDRDKSAHFLTGILGLPEATPYGPFLVVAMSNHVSLDFCETNKEIAPQHYAFLVTETEFDAIFKRICELKLDYWAYPGQTRLGQMSYNDGGRGLYFNDPNGHLLEIITTPYGGGS